LPLTNRAQIVAPGSYSGKNALSLSTNLLAQSSGGSDPSIRWRFRRRRKTLFRECKFPIGLGVRSQRTSSLGFLPTEFVPDRRRHNLHTSLADRPAQEAEQVRRTTLPATTSGWPGPHIRTSWTPSRINWAFAKDNCTANLSDTRRDSGSTRTRGNTASCPCASGENKIRP